VSGGYDITPDMNGVSVHRAFVQNDLSPFGVTGTWQVIVSARAEGPEKTIRLHIACSRKPKSVTNEENLPVTSFPVG
jgi:hypothetical protein